MTNEHKASLQGFAIVLLFIAAIIGAMIFLNGCAAIPRQPDTIQDCYLQRKACEYNYMLCVDRVEQTLAWRDGEIACEREMDVCDLNTQQCLFWF